MFSLSDDLKTDRARITTTITQSVNYIHPSLLCVQYLSPGESTESRPPFSASVPFVSSDVLFKMNHKTLAVLCPLSVQAELCAGVLADVIRCVLSGSDGCVLGLGCADVGE